MKTIVFTKRNNDIHACLEGDPKIWGCGKTQEEALLSLLKAHSDKFGLKLEWNTGDGMTARFLAQNPPKR